MTRTRLLMLGLGAAALFTGIGAVSASCSQTPTNIPVRTFELAQRMDVVCIQVNDQSGNPIQGQPVPQVESQCAPVAVNGNGTVLPFHLFAAVTQLGRGELAMVDLTAGNVVDEDRSTPGINFIPVGAVPTDVAVSPDAQMTFVSSADPNKPAIYGIPNNRILGDSSGTPPKPPLQLTDLLPCALPQPPSALSIAPVGTTGRYVLIAMLDAFSGQPARIAAIDPTPLLEGAGLIDAGPGVAPGSLSACTVLGATTLSPALPPSFTAGPAWPNGVPYAGDAGISLVDAEPSLGPTCSTGGTGTPEAGAFPLTFGPLDAPHPKAMVMRDDVPLLYVTDQAVPVIHVIDLSDPTSPREQAPLLATSVVSPQRRVVTGALAISPPTRDFKRYLYAVDASDGQNGSVMVFDITDPVASPHEPLQRPNAELNPFMEPDRLTFSAPIATLAFVQHDWPLPSQTEGLNPINQFTGLLATRARAPCRHRTRSSIEAPITGPTRPASSSPRARWRTSRSGCAGSSPS